MNNMMVYHDYQKMYSDDLTNSVQSVEIKDLLLPDQTSQTTYTQYYLYNYEL